MTPSTQRHHTPSANESKHAIRSGSAWTVAHRRKTTGRADPHTMATRKDPHMGYHRHQHRRRLIPSTNIGEGWWRCRERRHQEAGQARWSSTNVHVHSTGVRNARTHWRRRCGISSRAGPPPRSHQRRQPSDVIIVPANLHHAAAVQRYHVRWYICVNFWAKNSVLMTLQGQRTPLSFLLSVCVRFPFRSIFSVRILFYWINNNNNINRNNNNDNNKNNNNNKFRSLILKKAVN